ncbi:MAG: hypothetical protein GY772_22235, partial [bacterium]|nr:hypothetical protein [bacterium]
MCSLEDLAVLRQRHRAEPFPHVSMRDANTVLKHIRRSNTALDGSVVGSCASGFPGVDLTHVAAQEVYQWNPAAAGPGGGWEVVPWRWNWRHFVAALDDREERVLLSGQGVVSFGVCPILGTRDPLPGMAGPMNVAPPRRHGGPLLPPEPEGTCRKRARARRPSCAGRACRSSCGRSTARCARASIR